jgi:hypothetical protein
MTLDPQRSGSRPSNDVTEIQFYTIISTEKNPTLDDIASFNHRSLNSHNHGTLTVFQKWILPSSRDKHSKILNYSHRSKAITKANNICIYYLQTAQWRRVRCSFLPHGTDGSANTGRWRSSASLPALGPACLPEVWRWFPKSKVKSTDTITVGSFTQWKGKCYERNRKTENDTTTACLGRRIKLCQRRRMCYSSTGRILVLHDTDLSISHNRRDIAASAMLIWTVLVTDGESWMAAIKMPRDTIKEDNLDDPVR